MEPLIGSTEGFFVYNGVAQPLERPEMTVVSKTLGPGLFRWPVSWKGNFKILSTPYPFTAELSERMNVASWVIGGFAVGIAKGVIKKGDKVFHLYGLGELLI